MINVELIHLSGPEEQVIFRYNSGHFTADRALEILNRTREPEITEEQLRALARILYRDWNYTI